MVKVWHISSWLVFKVFFFFLCPMSWTWPHCQVYLLVSLSNLVPLLAMDFCGSLRKDKRPIYLVTIFADFYQLCFSRQGSHSFSPGVLVLNDLITDKKESCSHRSKASACHHDLRSMNDPNYSLSILWCFPLLPFSLSLLNPWLNEKW